MKGFRDFFKPSLSSVVVTALTIQILVQPAFSWESYRRDRDYESRGTSYRDYFQKQDFQFKSSYQGQNKDTYFFLLTEVIV